MKKIMEMLQAMKQKNEKRDNKGFSLVELIIVIAIMAILVGVVGTQVIPYINKSKESKDYQIISSYGTAAMTAYSSNADKITIPTPAAGADAVISFDIYGASLSGDSKTLADAIKELTYSTIPSGSTGKFKSSKGKDIDKIQVDYNFTKKTITVQAYNGSTAVLDPVVSDM